MRILQVAPYTGEAWAYGGIPRVLACLSRGLAERGHSVTVCATDVLDSHHRLERASGGPEDVRLFRNVSNRLAYRLQLFLPVGLRAFLREHAGDFDVAHLHGCHHVPGALAATALKRAGVPYVLSPHGTLPLIERRRALKWAFDRTVGRGIVSGAAAVQAVSHVERAELIEEGVNAPIDVIPNPVESPPARSDPAGFRRRFDLGEGPLVLFLGKLSPRKGVETLVRAFRAGAPRAATLVIAGSDFGSESGLQRLAHHGAGNIRFTGLLRGQERWEALTAADLFVYPTRDEVFGLSALEAAVAGVPVIVGAGTGSAEWLRQADVGREVRFGDAAALAVLLKDTLAHPGHWKALAEGARSRVAERFRPETVVGQIEGLLQRLAVT